MTDNEWPANPEALPLFLTPDVVAKLLRYSTRTLERKRKEGDIPFVKYGRRVLYPRDAVLQTLNGRIFTSTAEAKRRADDDKHQGEEKSASEIDIEGSS